MGLSYGVVVDIVKIENPRRGRDGIAFSRPNPSTGQVDRWNDMGFQAAVGFTLGIGVHQALQLFKGGQAPIIMALRQGNGEGVFDPLAGLVPVDITLVVGS